jgi:hypothetical protein
MKQSYFWEANNYSDSKAIAHLSWNSKVLTMFTSVPPLLSILSNVKLAHNLKTHLF